MPVRAGRAYERWKSGWLDTVLPRLLGLRFFIELPPARGARRSRNR